MPTGRLRGEPFREPGATVLACGPSRRRGIPNSWRPWRAETSQPRGGGGSARALAEVQIHQHDVGSRAPHDVLCFGAVARLTDDVQVPLALDEGA